MNTQNCITSTSPAVRAAAESVTSVMMIKTDHYGHTTTHVGSWEDLSENHSAWLNDDQTVRALPKRSDVLNFASEEWPDTELGLDRFSKPQAMQKAHFLNVCEEIQDVPIGIFIDHCAVFGEIETAHGVRAEINFECTEIPRSMLPAEWEMRKLAEISDNAHGNQRTRFLTADEVAEEWEHISDEGRTHWKILEHDHATAIEYEIKIAEQRERD